MIGVAALTITLAVMSGLQKRIKERLLNMSAQVQIHSGEGSIAKYAEVEARVRTVAGVNGTDPFIYGEGMLTSGRGISGVIAFGIEPDNPLIEKKWDAYLSAGNLSRLLTEQPASPGGKAQAGSGVPGRQSAGGSRGTRDRRDPRRKIEGQDRRPGADGCTLDLPGRQSLDPHRRFRHRRDLSVRGGYYRLQDGADGASAGAEFLRTRGSGRWHRGAPDRSEPNPGGERGAAKAAGPHFFRPQLDGTQPVSVRGL